VSKSLVGLKIRSLANCGEDAAGDWGSRGRRFKSCHPDWDKQVGGGFAEIRGRLVCVQDLLCVQCVRTSPSAVALTSIAVLTCRVG
jgi:hypothetical protein